MPGGDGGVRIDCSLNTEPVDKDLRTLKQRTSGLAKAAQRVGAAIEQALKGRGEKSIEALDVAARKAQDAFSRQAETVKRAGDELKKWQDIADKQKAWAGSVSPQVSSNIESAEASLKTVGIRLDELRLKSEAAQEALKDASGRGSCMRAGAVSSALSKLSEAFSKIGKAATKGLQSVGAFFGKIGKGIGRLVQNRKQLDTASSSIEKLWGRLKRLAVTAILFNGLRKALNSLSDLMQKSLLVDGRFTASLGQLKGALFTAVYPIYRAVLPAINAFMSGVAAAAEQLAVLTSALFGMTVTQSQRSAAALYAQANALDATGSAAKAASKQVASFDEINKLSDEGNSSSTSAPVFSFDYSGAAEIAGTLAEAIKDQDFKAVGQAIGEKINGAVCAFNEWISWSKLKEKITAFVGDFTLVLNGAMSTVNTERIGSAIGSAISVAFSTANTWLTGIDWALVGTRIAQGLNGMIAGIDWAAIGEFFGNRVVALVNSVGAFAREFNWSKLGANISKSINAFFAKIDWANAGKAFTDTAHGLLTVIQDAIAGINWKRIGEDVSAFLQNVDWGEVVSDLAAVLGAAIGGLGMLLWGFIEDAVKDIDDYFTGKIEECGGDVAAGLLKGLVDGVVNIGMWLKENVVDPFVDAFKDLFGIHSPSTLFEGFGEDIMNGLKNGVSTAWQSVSKFLTDACNGAIDIFEGAANLIIRGANWVIDKVNSALNITLPDWDILGSNAGKSFGLHIGRLAEVTLSRVPIPKLASGAVIPPNREFMAVLGDQKQGTNIETPESLLRKIVREESGTTKELTLRIVSDRGFVRALKLELDQEDQRKGVKLVTVK